MNRFYRLGLAHLLLAIVLGMFISIAHPAQAAVFTVQSLNDSGGGSLRQAILNANSTSGADTITFAISGTILLLSRLPDISSTMTIDGSGHSITISGSNGISTVDVMGSGNLTLNGVRVINSTSAIGAIFNDGTLTITNSTFSGNSADTSGGAIFNNGTLAITNSTFSGNSADSFGGGIYNNDTLTITSSTFSGNSARLGGGIYNNGTLTITSSTFSGNSAVVEGGGIDNEGTLTITSSTFSGNNAVIEGGGIRNGFTNTLTITNSTFSTNSARMGGGIYNYGTVTAISSILNDGCTESGSGTGISGSGNVMYPERCGSADGVVADPLLAPLANNGGPTQTVLPQAGSPAIDAATGICPNVDQRGVARPQGLACDIGAVEVFDTNVSLPLLFPLGTITTPLGNPVFSWPESGATTYDLAVFREDGGATPIYYLPYLPANTFCSVGFCSIEPVAQTHLGETARLRNGAHVVYLRPRGGQWFGPFSFTLNAPPPDAVTVSLPISVSSLRPTFTWTLEGNAIYATGFTIYIAPTMTFDTLGTPPQTYNQFQSRIERCGSMISTTCSFQVPFDLLENTDYYLYILAHAPGGFSEGGTYGNGWEGGVFRVDSVPDAALPTELGVSISDGHPTITWLDDVNSNRYNVVMYNWTTSLWVYNTWHNQGDICTGGVCSVTPELPLANGSYSVFVGADGPGGVSRGGPFNNGYAGPVDSANTNEAGDFVLNFPAPPLVENLTASANSDAIFAAWSASPGTTWYYVWVGTAGAAQTYYWQWHSSIQMGCAFQDNECNITLLRSALGIPSGTEIYVAVQSAGPGGWQTTGGLVDNGFQVSDPVTMP